MEVDTTRLILAEAPLSRHASLFGKEAPDQWTQEVTRTFPDLSKPQAAGLATWSFGMAPAKSCASTAVAFFLAQLLAQGFHAVRQRSRECYQEARVKKGVQRRDSDVTSCFGPLRGCAIPVAWEILLATRRRPGKTTGRGC